MPVQASPLLEAKIEEEEDKLLCIFIENDHLYEPVLETIDPLSVGEVDDVVAQLCDSRLAITSTNVLPSANACATCVGVWRRYESSEEIIVM